MNSRKPKRSRKAPPERWERFLRLLRDQVLEPSEDFPTVRCWRKSDLQGLIAKVVRANTAELKASVFPTAEEVIDGLNVMGWLKKIPLEGHAQMYFLEMEARDGGMIDPLEVLQGYMPRGVLCFFGVLSYLELTTQIPPFYHVASIDKTPLPQGWKEPSFHKSWRNPLGEEIFRFEGALCYQTRRYAALMPGIHTRVFGQRASLRMTTLEQALLDALIYPVQCGGQSVAFESWARGVEIWNPERMADYLFGINRPSFDRRVGAMLEVLGTRCGCSKLIERIEGARLKIDSSSEEIPLLNGMVYSRINESWKVGVP